MLNRKQIERNTKRRCLFYKDVAISTLSTNKATTTAPDCSCKSHLRNKQFLFGFLLFLKSLLNLSLHISWDFLRASLYSPNNDLALSPYEKFLGSEFLSSY